MSESEILARDLPKILRKFYKEAEAHFPKNAEEGLIDLIEWLSRIPSKFPRKIYKSDILERKILTLFELKNINEIENIARIGGSLKPYLGDLTRVIRNRSSKKNDFFFSDWGLLHLHLGTDFENKKDRVSRSKRVLITKFDHNSIYFIDVVNHGRGYPNIWGDTSYLEIIYKNWPYLLEKNKIKGVTMSQDISNEERIKLRNAGINTPIMINGKFFLSIGSEIASDGSSGKAVHIASKINKELSEAEKIFKEKKLSNKEAFFVIKDKFSIGFLVPKENKYFSIYKESDNSFSYGFFKRLLLEIPLKTDKKFKEFITPKKLRR